MRLINGAFTDMISANDRALQFGDGVFRTLRLHAGGVCYWARQYQKLAADCNALGIVAPAADVLWQDILTIQRAAGLASAAIKIVVTRGESTRGYACPSDIQPNRLVQLSPLPHYPATLHTEGVRVRLCQTHASWQPQLAGVKHLNRLENVLARQEWQDPTIFEGLLLDHAGHVQSGVMSNLLLLHSGRVQTPRLEGGGVAGVMRAVACAAVQRLGYAVEEASLSLADVQAAQRVWLCNSLMGLVPVARYATHQWSPAALDAAWQTELQSMEQEEIQWLVNSK